MYKPILASILAAGCAIAAAKPTTGKIAILTDPSPADPLLVTMGQRKPVRVRVARNQATLIRLPNEQRVMNVYGADKGEGGVWSVDAGKVPTRFLAIKPKDKGIHTTLHVISNTGQEISFFVEEVTGVDSQFDAEVDVTVGADATAGVPEEKWIPVTEADTYKKQATSLALELGEATKRHQAEIDKLKREAQKKVDVALFNYQQDYPNTLCFGYTWNAAKAHKLGLDAAWSDDKFTYFKGSKVLALYEMDEDGKPSLIEYSYNNGIYTVKKLLYDGYFAIGTKKANKLTFHRDRGSR
jgi:hypothetical protein